MRRVVAWRAAAGRGRQRADRLHAQPAGSWSCCWGVLVGLGTGSMALAFVATVTGRWFVKRRGLVTGVLTAGGAAGQLVFLPVLAVLVETDGWRTAALVVAVAALAVVPLVLWLLRDHPADLGVPAVRRRPRSCRSCRRPAAPRRRALRRAARRRPGPGRSGCWPAGSRSAARPPTGWSARTSSRPRTTTGWPRPTAAGLLALVGLFDIVGHDRLRLAHRPGRQPAAARRLLRPARASLLVLPALFADDRTAAACWCSSCSTGWTGWRPCRRRSRCAGSTSATRGRGGVRLGVRLAPVRRGDRGDRRRAGPRPARQLRLGLVRRRGARRGRGRCCR